MNKENLDELTVGGYTFATHTDAELAQNEINKIAYIESKMDMSNMTVVLGIYNKALESHTFQTPIGLEFMHSMNQTLMHSGIDKSLIKPIPLYTTFKRMDSNGPKERKKAPGDVKKDHIKEKYRNSVLINVILAVLLFVLLLLSLNSDSPNIINYKKSVTNQYASWEQELKQREAAVREKEKELELY